MWNSQNRNENSQNQNENFDKTNNDKNSHFGFGCFHVCLHWFFNRSHIGCAYSHIGLYNRFSFRTWYGIYSHTDVKWYTKTNGRARKLFCQPSHSLSLYTLQSLTCLRCSRCYYYVIIIVIISLHNSNIRPTRAHTHYSLWRHSIVCRKWWESFLFV